MKIKSVITSFAVLSMCVCGLAPISKAAYTPQPYYCGALYEGEDFSNYIYSKTNGNELVYVKKEVGSNKKNLVKMCTVREDGTSKVKKYVIKDRKMSACGMIGTNIILKKDLCKIKKDNRVSTKIIRKKYRIAIMNKKGVIKNSYDIPVATKVKKSIIDFIDVMYVKKHNKKIYVDYYVHFNSKEGKKGNYWNEYFLCYDTEDGKVISDKLLSKTYKDKTIDSNIFDKAAKTKDIDHYLNAVGGKDNSLYSYGKNASGAPDEQVLVEKDLSGRVLNTYVLPEGATTITNYGDDADLYPDLSFKGFSFGDRYIYYINRNGVYRCDTEGNGQFELIYDGKADPLFNPEKGKEKRLSSIKVLENEDFYLSFKDADYNDAGDYLYKYV